MRRKVLLGLILLFSGILCMKGQTPALNQKIVDYVSTQIGKKVDRGECWDLAYQALTQNHCAWDGKYAFGKKVNPNTDSVYAGDLLQFEGVSVKYREKNMTVKESFQHHTAIIYEVLGKGHYKIAHQNYGNTAKKVVITELKLSNKVSGNIFFYRPVSKNK